MGITEHGECGKKARVRRTMLDVGTPCAICRSRPVLPGLDAREVPGRPIGRRHRNLSSWVSYIVPGFVSFLRGSKGTRARHRPPWRSTPRPGPAH